jgi:hypothetical protein
MNISDRLKSAQELKNLQTELKTICWRRPILGKSIVNYEGS